MLFSEDRNAADMVGVFVRNEDRLHFLDRQAEAFHTFFGFATGDAHIYQNRFVLITNVIAVAVAPGI